MVVLVLESWDLGRGGDAPDAHGSTSPSPPKYLGVCLGCQSGDQHDPGSLGPPLAKPH